MGVVNPTFYKSQAERHIGKLQTLNNTNFNCEIQKHNEFSPKGSDPP